MRAEAAAGVSPAISIRKAEILEAGPLAELMIALGYPTTENEMEARLSLILPRIDYLVAVALSKEQVVGVVGAFIGYYLEMNGRYGRVIALSVASDHRGRGIGARLLAHTEAWLRAGGAAICIVNSSTHRTIATASTGARGIMRPAYAFRKTSSFRSPCPHPISRKK